MSQSDDTNVKFEVSTDGETKIHDTKDPKEVFITTRPKIKLALIKYRDGIRARDAWIGPATLSITLFSTILVADFGQFLGFSAQVWEAVFILSLIISLFWLVKRLKKWWDNKDKASINYIIEELESEDINS